MAKGVGADWGASKAVAGSVVSSFPPASGDGDATKLRVQIDSALHRRLRIAAVEGGAAMRKISIQAVQTCLQKSA